MSFANEREFEDALIVALTSQYGWDSRILENPTPEELKANWARILFENNRTVDRLNDYPLTEGEMSQIFEQLAELKTPVKLNGFINGRFITIKRDNPDDKAHFGKEISLKIYDRSEIAGGTSRYQIARQPKFPTRSKLGSDRRGDLTLLINGMPVIHLELKKSGVPLGQACNQLRKYSDEGVFTGIFSLVQVFVAMSPEETVYFANPGSGASFNSSYFFHWADFNNEPINDWRSIARELLSIPMAHQLIGFYTVADDADDTLKVMRSYQYYAAKAISDAAARTKWDGDGRLGGYVWHTTGSGKTMTSFKSAQLIRASGDADKVVFLVDRIELGTQSFKEYNSFANDDEEVQGTENTGALVAKLKSANPSDGLIVTSIQKMCRIRNEDEGGLKASDVELMKSKRVVFIVDECHRSTFGDMLTTIKRTFPNALFFGFTGTPIQEENQKKESTTATVFGNELHRYSIADGIRDENVLGFDPYKILTFNDDDLRKAVALRKLGAATVEDALADPKKKKTFDRFCYETPMGGRYDEQGKFVKGVENYLPNSQYGTEHKKAVVKDVLDGWEIRSRGRKFCAIFATSSIPDAIEYYRLFKATGTDLQITALFDPNIDDKDRFDEWCELEDPTNAPKYLSREKEEGLLEIIEDYNRLYNRNYDVPTFQNMKKDISARLAHKDPHQHIDKKPDARVDLLIVVDQMLTGFDSKWVNTLYLDKELRYENIIQAFSRTNRLFGKIDKPFGMIRYYRRPHTMENAIAAAVKLYSGDKPLGLFVDRLPARLLKLNALFGEIRDVFQASGVENFEKLPREKPARQKFATLFNNLQKCLEAAKIQGFVWDQSEYESEDKTEKIVVELTREIYDATSMRYRELHKDSGGTDGGVVGDPEAPYDLETRLTSIETDAIDKDYINASFKKFLKSLASKNSENIREAENELHRRFATLSQEDQALAARFLGDVLRGDVKPRQGKKFGEYLAEYRVRDENDRIAKFAQTFGLDENLLRKLTNMRLTEANLNEHGRFDKLKEKWDKQKAKAFFEAREGESLPPRKVSAKFNNYLRDFVLGKINDEAN